MAIFSLRSIEYSQNTNGGVVVSVSTNENRKCPTFVVDIGIFEWFLRCFSLFANALSWLTGWIVSVGRSIGRSTCLNVFFHLPLASKTAIIYICVQWCIVHTFIFIVIVIVRIHKHRRIQYLHCSPFHCISIFNSIGSFRFSSQIIRYTQASTFNLLVSKPTPFISYLWLLNKELTSVNHQQISFCK